MFRINDKQKYNEKLLIPSNDSKIMNERRDLINLNDNFKKLIEITEDL